MSNRHFSIPEQKARIAMRIRATIRRRRIPLARAAAFMGMSAEKFGQVLVGGLQQLSEAELADGLKKLNAWINPGTFGGTQAAVNLAEILSEINDPGLTHAVGRFMTCQSEAIKALSLAPSGHGRNMLASLLRRSWDHALPGISDTVRSHAMNVLIARWRLLKDSGGALPKHGSTKIMAPRKKFFRSLNEVIPEGSVEGYSRLG